MPTLSARLSRRWLSLILGAAAILLVLNCLVAPRGVRDLMVLRAHRMQLEVQLRHLMSENAELGTRVQKLKSDDVYLKRLVRNEFGFARPDELIYLFSNDDSASDR
jgi:cell division protein FtsB